MGNKKLVWDSAPTHASNKAKSFILRTDWKNWVASKISRFKSDLEYLGS